MKTARKEPGAPASANNDREQFIARLGQATTLEDIYRGGLNAHEYREHRPVILQYWRGVGVPGAASFITGLLDGDNAKILFSNKFFSEERYREYTALLVSLWLGEKISGGLDPMPSTEWARSLLLEGARRKWHIRKEDLAALKRKILALQDGAGTASRLMENMALFADVLEDDEVREALLKRTTDRRLANALSVARGKTWRAIIERLVSDPAVEAGMGFQGTATLGEISRTAAWQLEGLTRADALPLLQCGDERIRALGLHVATLMDSKKTAVRHQGRG